MNPMQTILSRHATGRAGDFKPAGRRRLLAGASMLSALASLAPRAAGAQATAQDAAGVQAFLTDWVTAWNAHDADAVMRLHAEDCVTVNSFGVLFPDRKATTPDMRQIQALFKDAQFPPFRVLNERSFGPDLVMLQAAWQVPSGMPSPAPKANEMIVSFLLKRSAHRWLAEEVDLHKVDALPASPKK